MADNVVDKEIVDLPEATGVTGDTVFPGYVPGALNPAQKITAEQLKEYFGQEVFVAVYRNTPLADIKAAYNAGKLLFLEYNGQISNLINASDEWIGFGQVAGAMVFEIWLDMSTGKWEIESKLLETVSSRTNVVDKDSTDANYPTAKAVYEFGKSLTIEGGGGEGLPGSDGEDGGYYIPNVSQPDQYTMQVDFTASKDDMAQAPTSYITLPPGPQGPQGQMGQPGSPGSPGMDGADGVGIENIELVEASDTGNTYKITLTDASSYTFVAPSGPEGPEGPEGPAGPSIQGPMGPQGPQGPEGPRGVGIENIFLVSSGDDGNRYAIQLTNGAQYTFVAPQGPEGPEGPEGEPGTTSWEGLTDRPFYSDVTTGEYILNKTAITTTYDAMGECYSANYDNRLPAGSLVAGDTYVVGFEDKNYVSVAFNDNEGGGYVCVGNMGLSNWKSSHENTGEPFCIMVHTSEMWAIFHTEAEGMYTFSIAKATETIKPLDEKYIPDTIARTSELAEAVSQLSEDIGDIDTALDAILAIQNSYIGGEGA